MVDYNQCCCLYCLLRGLPSWEVMRRTAGQVRLFEMASRIEVGTHCSWYAIDNKRGD